jgi:glycosyltransferase involved in cell wall biosynthesis
MRVALLHFCFEDYTIELANALVNFVDLTIIQPHKIAAYCKAALDPRIQICSFKKPRIRDPRNFLAMGEMMQMIQSIQPDVLHVQETNDLWYDMTLLLNKMPPLVTTIHDVYRHPGDRHSVFGSEYTKRISMRRSQQLIVHTRSLHDILNQQFHIAEQRINVVPHGELGSLYRQRSLSTDVKREPHTILFFGRIWAYKGLHYLLEALPLVAQHIPDVKLIVAGRGEDLDQYFPEEPDSSQVELLNEFIPTEAVAGLFQRSAATILPYTEASQSGVAALSYGLGTPVIASNLGGLREIVRHEQDGLLVQPGDVPALAEAIVKLLSSPDLQQRMQIAALERCQSDLNWSKIAAQTLDVYYKEVENNPRSY